MKLFSFLKKDPNVLSKDEKEAALILRDIVYGNKIGDPNYLPDGTAKLAMGLYYLAFKRANRKPVEISKARDPLEIMKNPKLLEYFSVFKSLKETLDSFSKNPIVLLRDSSIHEYEQSILEIMKSITAEIKSI